MNNLKYAIGIDVSMKDFACCLSVINNQQEVKVKASHKFTNNIAGFQSLLVWIKRHVKEELPVVFVMEATGVYHEQLAWFLHEKDQSVSILLPNKAKSYLKANGAKSKERPDRCPWIGTNRSRMKLEQWILAPSLELYTLRHYTRFHQSLNEMYTAAANQLHSMEHSQFKNKLIIKQLKSSLKLYEKQMKELEDIMTKIIKIRPVRNQHHQNICAIKGFGTLSFAVIAAETNGFALFDNAASLVSYAGYVVVENQSGKHTGRTKISIKGNSRIMANTAHACVMRCKSMISHTFQRLFERVYGVTRH